MTVKAPILSLQGVTKRYADTDVLGGIDLEVQEGEFVAILGFSGAGKTTLIGAVAGLVEPDGGKILLRGKPIDGPDKERGLVFQSYSLFPWLSVEQNVAAYHGLYLETVARTPVRRPVLDGAGDPQPFAAPAEAHVPGRWTEPTSRAVPTWAVETPEPVTETVR